MGIIDVKIEKPALLREERAEESDDEADATEEESETAPSRRGRLLTGLAAIGTAIVGILTLRRLRERRRES